MSVTFCYSDNMKKARRNNVSVITRLENAIAIAAMRKDAEAEAKFTKALESVLNGTPMKFYI